MAAILLGPKYVNQTRMHRRSMYPLNVTNGVNGYVEYNI